MKAASKTTKKTAKSKKAAVGKDKKTPKPDTEAVPASAMKKENPAAVPPSPAGAKKTASSLWLGGTALALVVGVGAVLAWPQVKPLIAPYFPPLQRADKTPANKSVQPVVPENDKKISELEAERKRLQQQLKSLIVRTDALEKELLAVRGIAEKAVNKKPVVVENNADQEISIEKLRQRLKEVEQGKADNAKALAQLQTFQQNQKIKAEAEQQKANVSSRLNQEVSEIKSRLAELEKNKSSGAVVGNNAAAIVLGVAQLRDAVETGKPFVTDVQALRALAGSDRNILQPLSELDAVSESGVPTLRDLRAGFDQMVQAVLKTKNAKAGDGLVDKALQKMRSLVTVRRTDGGGDDFERLLSEAEKQLAASDLAGVVRSLDRLGGMATPQGKAAGAWLADARKRLLAERLLAGLHVYAVSLLASGTGEQG